VSEERGYPKRQEGKIRTFQSKTNVVQRLLLDKSIFSNRENGFLFLLGKYRIISIGEAPPLKPIFEKILRDIEG